MIPRFAHISIAAAVGLAASLLGVHACAQETALPLTPFIFDTVTIERAEVYDSAGVLGFLNDFHTLTRQSVIEEEIYFAPGDTITQNDLNELERNLRDLEIFSRIAFTVTPHPDDEHRRIPRATLHIRTKDSWSLRSSGSFSMAGDDFSAIASLREVNALGLATHIGGSLEYSTINDRGFRIAGLAYQPNIAGSHITVGASGALSRFETSASLFLEQPYYAERVHSAFAAGASMYRGRELFYLPESEGLRRYETQTRTGDAAGWYSIARGERGNLFFASGALSFDRTTRDSAFPFASRAFENSVGTFIGLQSIKRRYERLENADLSGDRLIPLGGMGAISIGKISPHSGGLDNVLYLGAEARNAVRHGPVHLFGALIGATGLSGRNARFTLQRFTGATHIALAEGALAARVDQVTVWNWPRYVALPLDNSSGLRGYDLSELFGHSRVVANLEYRLHPIVKVWILNIGAAAFYDIGAVWYQGTPFDRARFHSSAGLGLRIGSTNSSFNRGLLRIDFAYNFDERSVSRLVISSQEAFDAFGTLDYRPPGPYIP